MHRYRVRAWRSMPQYKGGCWVSPSKVYIVLDFLGQYFCSGDVTTVFVCRSWRWFLLGTARMFLVPSQVDICRQLLQDVCELLGVHAAEDAPVRTGDGDHHPIIGLRDLQGQVIRGEMLLDLLPPVDRPQGSLQHRHGVVGQQC